MAPAMPNATATKAMAVRITTIRSVKYILRIYYFEFTYSVNIQLVKEKKRALYEVRSFVAF
jgi:type II secretory pathway component PulC